MIEAKNYTYLVLLFVTSLFSLTTADGFNSKSVKGWAGKQLGSWHWQLPNTDNGLKPIESWHAIGSAPNGDIYIGGMDHVTNSALYRLESKLGTVRYVGDARSASLAANNWQPTETGQKFHTRPLWYNGKVYVATMDRSNLNDDYLSSRGFHLYAYNPKEEKFTDLSSIEPLGIGAKHVSIVSTAVDPNLNVLYGAAVPTADIYKYDIATGRTENLGRPTAYDKKYPYTGRVMWVDSRSRLYFSTGNLSWGEYNPSIYGHIYYYDPAKGFGELKNWKLQESRAIELGQCLLIQKQCLFSDDRAHIYRFDDSLHSWSYIGQAKTVPAEIFSFNISADGKKAYIVTSSLEPIPADIKKPNFLYEFDITTKTTRKLVSLRDLDPKLAASNRHTGYNAWDSDGRFYFTSFASYDGIEKIPITNRQNAIVTRIDPVRLKVALGILPSLTEVTVSKSPQTDKSTYIFTRKGNVKTIQEVIYKLIIVMKDGTTQERYGKITIPPGILSVTVPEQQFKLGKLEVIKSCVLSLIPNGNDYITGTNSSVKLLIFNKKLH